MNFSQLLPKIIGFIVIVITVALSPAVYTANLTVVNYSSLATFLGMTAIAPYGGFLLILGILIAQGLFAIAGARGTGNGGWKDLFTMVGTVVCVIIILNLYSAAILPGFLGLVNAASVASDTIGQTVFAVFPIVIYLGIIIGAIGFSGVKAAGQGKKKSKKSSVKSSVSYA